MAGTDLIFACVCRELSDGVYQEVRGLLVGREDELGCIEELLERLSSGGGAVALLQGPAGIGKSALLAAAAQRASSRGFRVLRAVGGELELEHPFGVVRQLFWPVVASGWGDLGKDAAALAAVPLRLRPPRDRNEPLAFRGCSGDEAAAMHGLYWLTADLAERAPLLLVVDDVHWADEMSLRFMLYLGRRLYNLPALVLVAARPEAEHSAGGTLARLGSLTGVAWLRPAMLTESQVGQMIAGRGWRDVDARFVAACHHASGGNPFLAGELITALRAAGAGGSADEVALVARAAPREIVRWVQARLSAIGEHAERLAAAFAVLGASAALADAAALAELDPVTAATAADAMVGAHLLAAGPGYGFAQPLVHSAAAGALGPTVRAAAHARAARMLAVGQAPLPRVASHLLAADPGRDIWAVDVLRAAAGEANLAGAPTSAATYLERALAESPPPAIRAELLLALGEARLQAGLPGATQRMRDALELSADPVRRAEICLVLGRALFATGDWAGASEVFRRGLGELADTAGEAAELSLELRGWHMTLSRRGMTAAETTRLRALAEDSKPPCTRAERLELAQLAYKSALSGARPHNEVICLARRALADGALLTETATDTGPYAAACYALAYSGEPREAITQLTRAIELSQRRGSPVGFGWFSLLRGFARHLCGEITEALADLQSARNAYNEEYKHWLPAALAHLALCLIERADLDGSARALPLPADERHWRAQPSHADYMYARGRLLAAQGRAREALSTLLECGRTRLAWKVTNPALDQSWRCEAALVACHLGERDRAMGLAADDLGHARTFGAPHALGIALRANGLIQGGSRGLAQLAESVAVLDGSGINLELARALTEQGAAMRRAGYQRDAREPLRRGLDLARRCGASALAGRAREELITAGARPRRELLTGAGALTASELRVAQMAVQGNTNRQIAQALFVSMKTVTTHLGHVYAKLGIAGRAQLAAALAADRISET